MVTHMKTTIELPDELLISAKQKAASQRTTLKCLIERALRREIYPAPESSPDAVYEVDETGIPILKGQGHKVGSDVVYGLLEETDREL